MPSKRKHGFSGLMANMFPYLQEGTKNISRKVNGTFHHLFWGYWGWSRVAKGILKDYRAGRINKPVVLIGHSNGVYAAIKITNWLDDYNVPVVLVSIDRTLKPCPQVGNNVVYLMDNHAELSYVRTGSKFKGVHDVREWKEPRSHRGNWHVGVAEDPRVHKAIVDMLKENGWLKDD